MLGQEAKRETKLEKGTRISQYTQRFSVYIPDLPQIPRNLPKISSKWNRLDLTPYKVIMSNAVALLNSHGGKIYFGVSKAGIVEGCDISRETIDHYLLIIDDVFTKIQPIVPRQNFRVTFLPVEQHHRPTRYQVMCIRVDSGSKSETYWDMSNPCLAKVFLRTKGAVTGPLSPNEIGKLVLERYRQFLTDGGRIHALVKATAVPSKRRDGDAGDADHPAAKRSTLPKTSSSRLQVPAVNLLPVAGPGHVDVARATQLEPDNTPVVFDGTTSSTNVRLKRSDRGSASGGSAPGKKRSRIVSLTCIQEE